jgi:O-antigen/teichoic acid export membrane protein
MLLIATSGQKFLILSPVLEGVVNLFVSVILAKQIGAIGVAWGTVAGGCIGVLFNYMYNMRRTQHLISFQFKVYLWRGILMPILCFAPMFSLLIYKSYSFYYLQAFLLWSCSIVIAAYLFYDYKKGIRAMQQLLEKVLRGNQ